uniref:Ig-like domain-containing protein n=1 Tax=Pyxicephalus adspersus TaxID=30357 RepID=A0AAV3AG01_PYXAD|nr:TPA: hypothetical protein GDO54_014000 [Pyxicephalus adspersus]
MKASLGQQVRMSCQLGGGLTVSSNSVQFLQQKDMNKPKFIMRYISESSKWRGNDVPAHFVVSGSGSTGYMDIIGVQEEDEANYHCATWAGNQ